MNRWLVVVIGVALAASLVFQAVGFYRFKSAGKRFTAEDGQALCERIAALENGMGQAGECRYSDGKPK